MELIPTRLPYVVGNISGRDMGKEFEVFLDDYIKDKTAEEDGLLLIESIPHSRLKKSGSMIAHSGGVVTVRAYRGSEVPGSSGIFRLQYKDKKKSVQWVHEAEKQPKSNAYSNIIEIIAAGNLFGSQCWDVSSAMPGIRQMLDIVLFPVTPPEKRFREMFKKRGTPDMGNSRIYVCSESALIPVQTSIAGLTTVFFHHRGSARHWIVIPPASKAVFEAKIRQKLYGGAPGGCSQFVRHNSIWITPRALRDWGVDFREIIQEAKELLVIFPDSYYYGYSSGFSIIESKFHSGQDWTAKDYKLCHAANEECRQDWLLPGPGNPPAPQPEATADAGTKRKRDEAPAEGKSEAVEDSNSTLSVLMSPSPDSNALRTSDNDISGGSNKNKRIREVERQNAELERKNAELERENADLKRERAGLDQDLEEAQSEMDYFILRKTEYKKLFREQKKIVEDKNQELSVLQTASSELRNKVADMELRLQDQVANSQVEAWKKVEAFVKKEMANESTRVPN